MIKGLISLSIIVIISACTVISEIDIKRDGSCHVDFYISLEDLNQEDEVDQMLEEEDDEKDYQTDSLEAVWKAPYCKNFDLSYDQTGIKWSFDLDHVNQLGDYISNYFDYQISFDKTTKSLVIDGEDGNCKTEDDPDGYMNLMKFDFTLNFEQNVKSIKSDCDCAEKISDNTVKLNSDLGRVNYNKQKNVVTIKLK